MNTNCSRMISTLVYMLTAAATVFAQADVSTATLKGIITDQSRAVVPRAAVTVTSVERGSTLQAMTDAGGKYQIPLLQPGQYDLRVEGKGFQPHVAKDVVLTIGQVVVYDLQLKVGDISTTVEVTANIPLIETERTQQANTIERKQIENLPLVNRNFTDLVFTLPGVASTSAAQAQNTRIGQQRSSGISVGGGNGRSNYFTIDGGENELGTGGLRVRNMSVDAVQEFQVNRNAFAAEYGFTAGTAINVITKGGGNNLHGSGYVFYRSQKTSARNAFDFVSKKRFDQRVYPGFTFGGPIIKNRAFFFTSYEMLKLDEARFKSYTNNPAILALSAGQAAYLAALTGGPAANADTQRIASNLRALLTVNSTTLKFLQDAEGTQTLPARTHNWTSRLDDQIGAKDNLTGRFTLADENNGLVGLDNLESFGRGRTETQRDYTAVGTWSHTFGASVVNQARIQLVKDKVASNPLSLAPTIAITGIINYGRAGVVPSFLAQKRYQFEDILSWNRSRHNLKFGFSYRPVEIKNYNEVLGGGGFLFAGLPLISIVPLADRPFLAGANAPTLAASLTALQSFQAGLPQFYQQGFGNALFTGVQENLGVFAQDSWKLAPRFTVDAGVRLDHDGEPKPLNAGNYVSPRLGFAWDLWGNGKTVLRGGGGTFYSPVANMIFGAATLQSEEGDHLILPTRTLQDGAQSSAAIWSTGVRAGKLPNTPLTAADITALGITIGPKQPGRRISGLSTDYQNPYSVQVSASISQQLSRNLAIEVSYQAFHGVHLPLGVEGNFREAANPAARCAAINPLPASQPLACQNPALYGPVLEPIDPTIAQFIKHTAWGNSIYHGMTASLDKRFSRNYQFQINYTLGKSIDDVMDFQGTGTPFIPTRRFLDRGLSTFNIRHNFVASGVFTSPFRNIVLRGITLSPIVNLRSGAPFTLYIGGDANGDANSSDRPFNAPRNSGIGPNYYATNLRINKQFAVRGAAADVGGVRVELIAEATNLFNQTNFLRVNDTICPATCDQKFLAGPFHFKGSKDIPATAPLGFTAAHPGRQLQFGLKIAF